MIKMNTNTGYNTSDSRWAGWLAGILLQLGTYSGSQSSDAAEPGDRGTIRVNTHLTTCSDTDVAITAQLQTSADNTSWRSVGSPIVLSPAMNPIGSVTSTGTSPPAAPSVSGFPVPGGPLDGALQRGPRGTLVGGHVVTLSIVTPGPRGAATVQIAIDGQAQGTPVVIPSGGVVSIPGGVTATFGAGTYGGDNVYSFAINELDFDRVVIPAIDKFVRTSLAVTGIRPGPVSAGSNTGSGAVPTLTGAPWATGPMAGPGGHTVTLTVSAGGVLGDGTFAVTTQIDSGSATSPQLVPSSGIIALDASGGDHGSLSAVFGSGTYATNDTFTFSTAQVTSPLGPVTGSSGAPAAPAIAGLPTPGGPLQGAHSVVLTISAGGGLGDGTLAMTTTIDGGAPSAAQLIPASGVVSVPGGLTATFGAWPYVTAQTYTFSVFAGPIAGVELDIEAIGV